MLDLLAAVFYVVVLKMMRLKMIMRSLCDGDCAGKKPSLDG